tara:strand:- start:944 stop:1741 length:798 start_codon:yes stop_codon:yes gene_type:complete
MDLIYLTDDLVFNKKDNYSYLVVSDKNNEFNNIDTNKTRNSNELLTQITDDNWKLHFNEYGWCDMEPLWELYLDDTYTMLECGAGGDCFFHCLSEAINLDYIYTIPNNHSSISNSGNNIMEDFLDIKDVRKIASDMITDDNFEFILECYKAEDESGEFQGDWNPSNINNKSALQAEIETVGDSFWADHIIIQLLSKHLKVNFIILNSNELYDEPNIINLSNPEYKKYIILYYDCGCHYKLIGRWNGMFVETIFDTIPEAINDILV